MAQLLAAVCRVMVHPSRDASNVNNVTYSLLFTFAGWKTGNIRKKRTVMNGKTKEGRGEKRCEGKGNKGTAGKEGKGEGRLKNERGWITCNSSSSSNKSCSKSSY